MYKKIYEILKDKKEPISTEAVAEKMDISSGKASLGLLRLQEEGKIEGLEKNGKLHWEVKTKDRKTEKIEKKMRNG
ncbi:MAG: ArsR family transcriptional regulator [Euryarchaeota archaeon]|nr:ArsR family transcriptional regulator [Euryarchaeota archaeon]